MDSSFETGNAHSFDLVRNSTSEEINNRIDQLTEANIQYYSARPDWEIQERIKVLDREWDVERVLEVNASTLALTGLVLGTTVNKKWLALPAIVLPFLLLHGLQGWCPPLPMLRRMAIRTRGEIDREKYALLNRLNAVRAQQF